MLPVTSTMRMMLMMTMKLKLRTTTLRTTMIMLMLRIMVTLTTKMLSTSMTMRMMMEVMLMDEAAFPLLLSKDKYTTPQAEQEEDTLSDVPVDDGPGRRRHSQSESTLPRSPCSALARPIGPDRSRKSALKTSALYAQQREDRHRGCCRVRVVSVFGMRVDPNPSNTD